MFMSNMTDIPVMITTITIQTFRGNHHESIISQP